MDIYTIPENFEDGNNHEFLVIDYSVTATNTRKNVILKKNVISFLQEGTKRIITSDRTANIDNRSFIIIGVGNSLMTETISENKVYRSILFFFDDSALSKFCKSAQISRNNYHNQQSYTTIKYDNYIKQFVNSLMHIAQSNFQNNEDLLKTKFNEIMHYLLIKHGSQFIANLFSIKESSRLNFKQVVELNKLNNLTLQELAFLCNMSVSSFKRYFTDCFQTSPTKWFLHNRLEFAAYLLKEERRRSSDIYLEVGFQSLSSFIRAFKLKYTVTPKQYQDRK